MFSFGLQNEHLADAERAQPQDELPQVDRDHAAKEKVAAQ